MSTDKAISSASNSSARVGGHSELLDIKLSGVMRSLVLLLVALPFGQLAMLKLGFITLDLSEILILLILLLSLVIITLSGVRRRLVPILCCWIGLVTTYIVLSATFWDVSIKAALVHFRVYLPFTVAILLLACPLQGSARKFLAQLVFAAMASASIAIMLHYFFPTIVIASFSHLDEVSSIIFDSGRLYWSNSLVILLLVALLFVNGIGRLSCVTAFLVASIATVATMNRTILIGVLLMLLLILISQKRASVLSRFYNLIIVVASIGVVVGFLLFWSDKFSTLVQVRITGDGDLISVYDRAVLTNRLFLYEQYWESLTQYFPFGQGLGRPLAYVNSAEGYTTDVSVLSFILPFGVAGLFMWLYFLTTVRREIARVMVASEYDEQLKQILLVLLAVLIVVSLNIDVFARNNSVVWLAIVVSLFQNSCESKKIE